MIQREIDLAKLDAFDWHRDMKETYQWLRNVGRVADATKLLDADRERFYRKHKNLKANG
jgi:hypothetical protein